MAVYSNVIFDQRPIRTELSRVHYAADTQYARIDSIAHQSSSPAHLNARMLRSHSSMEYTVHCVCTSLDPAKQWCKNF